MPQMGNFWPHACPVCSSLVSGTTTLRYPAENARMPREGWKDYTGFIAKNGHLLLHRRVDSRHWHDGDRDGSDHAGVLAQIVPGIGALNLGRSGDVSLHGTARTGVLPAFNG